MNRRKVAVVVAAVLVLAMCAFIFWMSAKVAADSDEVSLGFAARMLSVLMPGFDALSAAEQLALQQGINHFVRKAAHFCEFALLGLLVYHLVFQVQKLRQLKAGVARTAYGEGTAGGKAAGDKVAGGKAAGERRSRPAFPWRDALIAWACATAYAATDEIHQLFVPGRAGMIQDVLLDSSGVLAGVVLISVILWLARR